MVVDVQPDSLPLTMAYTASISAEVTVRAPATSRRAPVCCPVRAGRSRSDSTTTAAPIGRLTRKIQCQLRKLVSTPPSSTPIDPPPEATKPKMPMALARSRASVNMFIVSDSDTADATAPPTPWTVRPATSTP